MKPIAPLLAALLLLASARLEAQQTIPTDNLRLNTGPCVLAGATGPPISLLLSGTCSGITTAPASNLTLRPTGDLITAPAGGDVLPGAPYSIQLGSLTNKYLTLHAAELWVETLVSQNTIATIGGRIVVAPSNILTRDFPASTTSGGAPDYVGGFCVKYNSLKLHVPGVELGSKVILQSAGKFEVVTVVSTTTPGPSGAGDYCYTVQRDVDGSGRNDWYAGDAAVDSGKVGDGFIDLYSLSGLASGAQIGPSIVGNVRTGIGAADWAPRWAIGNLNGLYGYGATTYGAAFGDATATNITIDASTGFLIRKGTQWRFIVDVNGAMGLTGDLVMAQTDTSVVPAIHSNGATGIDTGAGFWLSSGTTPVFRVGNPAGDYIRWDGSTIFVNGRISVGTGRNQITNSECRVNASNWSAATNAGGSALTQPATSYPPWQLNADGGTCYVQDGGTLTSGFTDIYAQERGGNFPVLGGTNYELSVYVGVHRYDNVQAVIYYYDSTGAFVGAGGGNQCSGAAGLYGGQYLSGYCRTGVIVAAPANAVTAMPLIRLYSGSGNVPNPYCFYTRAYFGEATPGQTVLTAWGAAGATIITPGLIQADAITSDKIAAGTIVASDIAAGSITADRLVAGTITGGYIAAGAITADKLSVGSLDAISANLGHVTAGTITGTTIYAGGDRVLLNDQGITFAAGDAAVNSVKWNDGSYILSNGTMQIQGPAGVQLGQGGVQVGITGTNINFSSGGVRWLNYNSPTSPNIGRPLCVDQYGNMYVGPSSGSCI